jgi:hypothetical protein
VPLSDVAVLARSGGATAVYRGNEAWKLLNKASPFSYAATIDLPTDGATSAVAALNAAMAAGPCTILVDVPAGVVIDGPVLGRSGCELAFSAGTPVLMGPLGQFKTAGSWKEDYRHAAAADLGRDRGRHHLPARHRAPRRRQRHPVPGRGRAAEPA